jgi:hypothetical protein
MVIEDGSKLSMPPQLRLDSPEIETLHTIPYIDHPELKVDEHESTQMPFRYVRDEHGQPVMPKVLPYGFGLCSWVDTDYL